MRPRHIAAYISGHGYGHLAQIAPVLNKLIEFSPDLHLLLRTALPEELLKSRIRGPFTQIEGPVDVGVIQKNAIDEDIPATIAAARIFFGHFGSRIEQEIECLRACRPVAVLSDISPLAFPVAKQLGLPSFAIASLDWHDIYRNFLPMQDALLNTLQQAHAACDLLIQPPLSMPMSSFPRRRQVALIVDDPAEPCQMRNKMDGAGERTALIMFGGAGDPACDIDALGGIEGWRFLTLNAVPATAPVNVRQASLESGIAALMRECDIVVTKPGYGTLAECWQTGTPLAYLPRPLFPEYPLLDAWLQTYAPSSRLSVENFVAGHWLPAMQAALACPRKYPQLTASGAMQAAELIAHAL